MFAASRVEVIADPSGMCILVNPVLCQMTGFTPAELLSAAPYPYWPREELEAIRGVLARIEDAPSSELSFQRKNGERFPVLYSPALIRDARGHVLVALSKIVDLSATAALKASEQRWRSIAENPFDFSNVVGAISSDGEIRELSLLSRDITEAKRNERAQRRSERRLAHALASPSVG